MFLEQTDLLRGSTQKWLMLHNILICMIVQTFVNAPLCVFIKPQTLNELVKSFIFCSSGACATHFFKNTQKCLDSTDESTRKIKEFDHFFSSHYCVCAIFIQELIILTNPRPDEFCRRTINSFLMTGCPKLTLKLSEVTR